MARCDYKVAAAVVVAALSAPEAASAHPEMSPLLTNRYLTVTVLGDHLAVSYALLLGNLPGGELRRRMDADGDGRLTPGEVDAERARFLGEAGAWFSLSLDERAPALTPTATLDLGPDQSTAAAPMILQLDALLPLGPGRHRVRIEPLREPERLGETELGIDVAPGVALLESFPGERDPAQLLRGTRFKLEGPRVSTMENRSATFVFETHGAVATGATTPSRALGVFAGVAIVLSSALALIVRRRRQARPPGHDARM